MAAVEHMHAMEQEMKRAEEQLRMRREDADRAVENSMRRYSIANQYVTCEFHR